MAKANSFDTGRDIPETEKLGLEIESQAAAVFAPDSKPERVEKLVKMVNKRAHLTVQVHVATMEKYAQRRRLLNPVQIKLRSLKNRISARRPSAVGE